MVQHSGPLINFTHISEYTLMDRPSRNALGRHSLMVCLLRPMSEESMNPPPVLVRCSSCASGWQSLLFVQATESRHWFEHLGDQDRTIWIFRLDFRFITGSCESKEERILSSVSGGKDLREVFHMGKACPAPPSDTLCNSAR